MLEKFIKLINQYAPLTPEELEYMKEHIPFKEYGAEEMLLREGEYSNTIFFLLHGCIRLFYNNDGNDKTAFFYTEGKFICAGESYTFGVPAIENYQAMENSTVMLFHKDINNTLLQKFPNFELIARYAVEDELITSQKMIASFITKSPEERYLDLLERNGELFQRVHQQYIASYLGVSPETLSRIKKRIFSRQ
jgi:CRP/FNR family transcriptional regulator, anaerobic regulatory protein